MDKAIKTPQVNETPEANAFLESQNIDISDSKSDIEKKKKKRDFWISLPVSLVANLLLEWITINSIYRTVLKYYLPGGKGDDEINKALSNPLYALPLLLNIGVLIFFTVKHQRGIVKGILTSYGLVLLLTLIGGVVLAVLYYVMVY